MAGISALPPPTAKVLRLWGGCTADSPDRCVPPDETAVAWGGAPRSKGDHGTVMFTRPSPWCGKAAIWASTFVPGATAAHLDRFINHDPSGKFSGNLDKIDKMLKRKTLKARTASGAEVWHVELKKAMMGIAARDLVTEVYPAVYLSAAQQAELGVDVRARASPAISKALEPLGDVAEATGRVVVFSSVDAAPGSELVPLTSGSSPPTLPAPAAGVVRAVCHSYGLVGVERRGGCDVHFLMSVDPVGLIPAMAVDSANGDQMKMVARLNALMREQLESAELRPEPTAPPAGELAVRRAGAMHPA